MALSGVPRKKSPVTPPGIDPGTFRLVAQRLNQHATPGPYFNVYLYKLSGFRPYLCMSPDFHMTYTILPVLSTESYLIFRVLIFIYVSFRIFIYRVSQEEGTKLREGVPYVKLYRYNP